MREKQHGVIAARQLDEIHLAARLLTELTEFEPRHAWGDPSRVQLAAIHFDERIGVPLVACNRDELFAHATFRRVRQGRMIDAKLLQRMQAIVLSTLHLEDLQMPFQEVDRRQELAALQAVAIELVGLRVGGRHQHHAFGEAAPPVGVASASHRRYR